MRPINNIPGSTRAEVVNQVLAANEPGDAKLMDEFSQILNHVARKVASARQRQASQESYYIQDLAAPTKLESRPESAANLPIEKHQVQERNDKLVVQSDEQPRDLETPQQQDSEEQQVAEEGQSAQVPVAEQKQAVTEQAHQSAPEVTAAGFATKQVAPQAPEQVQTEQVIPTEDLAAQAIDPLKSHAKSQGDLKRSFEDKRLESAQQQVALTPQEKAVLAEVPNNATFSQPVAKSTGEGAEEELLQSLLQRALRTAMGVMSGESPAAATSNADVLRSAALSMTRQALDLALGNSGVEQLNGAQRQASQAAAAPVARADLAMAVKGADAPAASSEARGTKTVARVQLVKAMEQVEKVLNDVAVAKEGRTVSLRLDPPSLGSVKVEISLKDGGLYARLVAENPNVNNFLRERAHDLQSSLRKLGLDVDHINVSIGNNDQAQMNNQSQRERQQAEDMRSLGGDLAGLAGALGGIDLDSDLSAGAIASNAKRTAVEDHWVA